MAEVADLTYNVVAFSEIMQMIWKRTNDHGKNWRHVYKALLLLEYLIKTGSEKVAQQCKENIFSIQTLKDFQYMEEGKDQGVHVREKAKQMVILLKDDERLKGKPIWGIDNDWSSISKSRQQPNVQELWRQKRDLLEPQVVLEVMAQSMDRVAIETPQFGRNQIDQRRLLREPPVVQLSLNLYALKR